LACQRYERDKTAVGSELKPAVGSRQQADGRGENAMFGGSLLSAHCRLPAADFSSLPSAVSQGSSGKSCALSRGATLQ